MRAAYILMPLVPKGGTPPLNWQQSTLIHFKNLATQLSGSFSGNGIHHAPASLKTKRAHQGIFVPCGLFLLLQWDF